jgi:hypothetical protein
MAYLYEYLYKIDQLGMSDYILKVTDDSDESKVIFIPILLDKSKDTKENLNNIALKMIIILENEKTQQAELNCERLEQEKNKQISEKSHESQELQSETQETPSIVEDVLK